ncbi:MAG: alpha-L-fucosidase [Mediterranea sp.]|jgi:alpha-L-fucosidase|nr:alpha-L-fucosidase [Mediterranea sp.]
MRKPLIILLAWLALMPALSLAQQPKQEKSEKQEIPLKYGADRLGKRQDPAMVKFRDNRLGAFIHWGLYAIPGGEWDGKVYPGAAEWLKSWAKVPSDEWMKLMSQWNPTKFDATAWAKMFKDMGARYVKITTKHHEGFCLWPSKYSKYTVAQTPYKKDLLGEMVKAFNKEGIDVDFYFSVMDWSHPDYRYDIKTPEDSIAFSRFLEFTDNQLKELATRYPTVKDFWFDGTWDASIKENGWWTAHVEKMLKELVPGVTINSRLRADDYGKRHFDSNGHLMGDYESGYERRLPDPVQDLKVTQWDWEACMTLPENQWGYHKDWSLSYVKTPIEVIDRIVHAVSMGGNMVVNFGPQADGDFRPEEKAMAKAIGQWMHRYGQAVYACDYAGLAKQDWGYYTRGKQGEVYMVVFNQPYSRHLIVKTPKGVTVQKATLLTTGEELEVVETTRNEYNVSVPAQDPGEPYVIQLQLHSKEGNKDTYRDALT